MDLLNRDERQTLRIIQKYMHESIMRAGVVFEQVGTVDVYFHVSNPDIHFNCATPHKGVAWVRREDLTNAFAGLERLGRTPRLYFLEALFPQAFKQQIEMMALTLEQRRVMMVYRPLVGPHPTGEKPLGRLPHEIAPPITTAVATERTDLATWLRIFRAGFYNTESLVIQREAVTPLYEAYQNQQSIFVLARYEGTPLGGARLDMHPPTAELSVVTTVPLWHGMGLEPALITTAVQAALAAGCSTIFSTVPMHDFSLLYRLGFVDLTSVLTFWRAEDYARQVAEDDTTATDITAAATTTPTAESITPRSTTP